MPKLRIVSQKSDTKHIIEKPILNDVGETKNRIEKQTMKTMPPPPLAPYNGRPCC